MTATQHQGGGWVCICGRGPGQNCACAPSAHDSHAGAHAKVRRPRPGVPDEIDRGLDEIAEAIRENRNLAGIDALTLDVLRRILIHCDSAWPPVRPATYATAPDNGLSDALTADVLISVAVCLVLGLLGAWIGMVLGGPYAPRPPAIIIGAAVGLIVGGAISVALIELQRRRNPAAHPARQRGDSLTYQVGRLYDAGLITRGLDTLSRQADLDWARDFDPPPQPAEAVRRRAAFVLTLADQVIEGPRRISDARSGILTTPQAETDEEGHGEDAAAH